MTVLNPFLEISDLPFGAPDFSKIKAEHFEPAFAAGIDQQIAEVQFIAGASTEPTFENTLVELEKSGAILRRVSAVFFNLASANTTDEIQRIEEVIAPKLASHNDDVFLDKKLFARVEKLWNKRSELKLTEEQQRLLKETYETFVRAGAKLTDEQQTRVRAINEQLSKLTTQFQNNLLAITKERSLLVDDLSQLNGLSEGEIKGTAEAAKQRGSDGKYLLSITNTTRQPMLAALQNRELRKRLWEASAYRGLGRNDGIDNRGLILEIASIRSERAKLLGYPSHAAFTLENQMAMKPETAIKMVQDLAPQVVAKVEGEMKDIAAAMKDDGIAGPVEPWDWEYYAERVRAKRYAIDENLVKPYFEIDSVLKNGVFFTLGKLYGIRFEERFDLPVYDPTVRVFNVFDRDGSQLGLFYADYFHRDSKRGGAWMDAYVSQSHLLDQKPVILNVMNIPPPAPGEPALLSLDHVTTMFHELGHGVHGLFSNVTYPTLAGTATPRDFVEFPSTFHEDWAIDPIVLKNYAKHYKTGEVIPQNLLEKSIAASKFNKGFDTLEYCSAALLDLQWHSLAPHEIPKDVEKFEADTLHTLGLDLPAVPPRYKSAYFAHIWSGGYSAGYYAYLWSEVLAADAFAHMRSQGGLTEANGKRFRDSILSKGGSREMTSQYRDFHGQDPTVEGLLKRRGLK